jgi:aminoglycoside N3'-acetyltransferase
MPSSPQADRPVSQRELIGQLHQLGVEPGGVLLVHTAFSRVRPVEGGPEGLIAALRTAIGERGTLVMPSMSDDDDRVFDPPSTPCRGMGVVADTFWRLPGVLRSDSPHAFAAAGPRAPHITSSHPIGVPHGLDSPVGRVYELDGQVLLLGVGHDGNTTVHLAEELAAVRYRIPKYVTVREDGRTRRRLYAEIDHCCQKFALLDDWLNAEWLDAEVRQRRGPVGRADARLARSRHIVDAAMARLRADETIFLHAPGVDGECDAARASLPVRDSTRA